MIEPRTQTGRDLLADHWCEICDSGKVQCGYVDRILAIEAEALPSVERLARALYSINILPFAEEQGEELRETAAAILAALRDEP